MKRGGLIIWAGFVISLVALTYLVSTIDIARLLDALVQFDLRYLVAAVLITFISYWLRAVRWQILLSHERSIRFSSLFSSICMGYMGNNLFPVKIGEVVRAWSLAERERLQLPPVLASLVIDRLLDGMSVMLMLGGVLLALELPPGMEQAELLLKAGGAATLVLYCSAILFLILLKRYPMFCLTLLERLLQPMAPAVARKLIPLAGSFLGGLRIPRSKRDILLLALLSAFIWFTATIPVHLILTGFGLLLPVQAAFFIMVLLVFAVMLPSAPGYIGTYHLACYTGLAAYGLADTQAMSAALVIHGVGFFPVTVAGLWLAAKHGISIAKLGNQSGKERRCAT